MSGRCKKIFLVKAKNSEADKNNLKIKKLIKFKTLYVKSM